MCKRVNVKKIFHFVMIKPTHYDDDGYPIQWLRSFIPSNSLASVYGLALDCKDRSILGDDVIIKLHTIDEWNTHVNIEKIARMIHEDGDNGLIGLIGVQSNQFPRSVDLAKRFLKHGLQVSIGGFHVSGILSMLDKLTPELEEAQKLGISFFAGEAEEQRLDNVLRDAYNKDLKPIYNYLNKMPTLEHEPVPFLDVKEVKKTLTVSGSFDLGRGCPFDCSFCTIINVQGKKSRFRTPDDIEKILRLNHSIGIYKFFLTDDNFARNKNWEIILDRIISLRDEGIKISMTIQVDTLCHKIPNFIKKCSIAGVDKVFIGLESIDSKNLIAIKKKQNKINDYKEMILEWKKFPVVITAAYIIGLPNDTRTSIVESIKIIKKELAIDIMYFTILTPLPGSEDHKNMFLRGEWMDNDLNQYDLNHVVMKHVSMDKSELMLAFNDAWDTFYTTEHLETILKRMVAFGSNKKRTTFRSFLIYKESRSLYNLHPLESGVIRLKYRKERRGSFKQESILTFYPKYFYYIVSTSWKLFITYMKYQKIMNKIWKDKSFKSYRDSAMIIDDLA